MLDIALLASEVFVVRRGSSDDDPGGHLHYIPSNVLTTIAVAVFGSISAGLIWRLWRGRWRAWYMIPMTVGGLVMTFGLSMRYLLRSDPHSMNKFLMEYLSVVLSPCGFIASDYAILGRLAQHTNTNHYLLVRARWLTKLFVLSDFLTFLIQASGGAMSTSDTVSKAKLGDNLFKVGMILQCISFICFSTIYAVWLFRVRKNSPDIWTQSESIAVDGIPYSSSEKYIWRDDWRALAGALVVSCIGILIRSAYRTAEGLQGFSGKLATSQATFYLFDTLPLTFATTIFILFWPGNYIDPAQLTGYQKRMSMSEHELMP